ncbi:unnamed protein product [Caenorhabditis auriculariae]|uniref:Neuropathy target esterase sws n=1 Tax=Caenorhabditis auriculariae TaxID=2777116 RepID=A0A8S1H7W3_9PELO|nr:unnamed protein product [Caenorhabditis auriculariae]
MGHSVSILKENDEEDEKVGDEYQDHVKSTGIRVFPGELLPSMQLLTDERAVYSLIAESDSTLVVMRREKFSKFLESHPQVYVPIAHNILRFLSPFVRSVDFALEWLRVDSGQAIYRAGEIADTMYIVLSGRLRSVEKKTVLEEFGKGDVLGLMEMTEKKNRASTVLAVRFSQLACIPQGLLNYFKLTHPEVGVRLIQLLRKCWKQPFSVSSLPQVPADAGPTSFRHNKNLRTIALVPACADVPLVAFTCEFYNALSAHLKVLRISSTQLNARFSSNVLEKKFDFMLMQYLNVQENSYPLIIYECDFGPTAWTSRCLRQADAVIVVGLGDRPPEDQALATQLLAANERVIRSNKELVILWPDKTRSPSNTGKWLRYSFFSGHHHVRAPERMYQFGTNCDEKTIIKYYEKHVFGVTDPLSDFARLARIFTGNAVGIVLGGGGARGAAHAGVMRAILEQGIPVDLIGGTSIGSLFAGMFAGSPNKKAFQRFHDFFSAINVLWRTIFLDLTYAHSAFLTGVRFNRVVEDQFKKTEIEDLWISYFCVSTDLTTSKMRIHRSGLLWPLVRASMTIAGYLPPLCDPSDGHLLVDGAYVNNLPADVMRSLGARVVIAVDVGVTDKNLGTNYGVSLNGFWVLFKKIFPLGEPIKVLNMSEIQNRLAFVCCEKQLEEIKKAPYCHYFRPPIESFDPSDFSQFNVAADIGYAYAITRLKDLMSNEKTRAELLGSVVQTFFERRRFVPNMRDKFTRMAASISKVPRLPLTCSSSSDLSQKGSSKSDSESTNSTQFS